LDASQAKNEVTASDVAGAGEEYWKYESALKNGMQVIFSRWSSRRIIPIRTALYKHVEKTLS
jgi:hypothetical protein